MYQIIKTQAIFQSNKELEDLIVELYEKLVSMGYKCSYTHKSLTIIGVKTYYGNEIVELKEIIENGGLL